MLDKLQKSTKFPIIDDEKEIKINEKKKNFNYSMEVK
jgi:hypothetical protein